MTQTWGILVVDRLSRAAKKTGSIKFPSKHIIDISIEISQASLPLEIHRLSVSIAQEEIKTFSSNHCSSIYRSLISSPLPFDSAFNSWWDIFSWNL